MMPPYSKKHLYNLLEIAVVATAFGMQFVSSVAATAGFLALAIYALFGRAQSIKALALTWLFTMLSPGIAAEATLSSFGRYAVLAAASLSAFYHSNLIITRIPVKLMTLATILLGIFLVVHTFIFSQVVDVSLLKVLSWTLVMTTLFSAWLGLDSNERELLSCQIFIGLILVMLVSFPLLALPLGYLRNGSGFQGILNHPQAFGPTMALLGAWATSRMVSQKQPSWSTFGLGVACLAMIILSEARTAGVALVLGVGIAVVVESGLSEYSVLTALPGLRSRRLHLMAVIGISGAILAAPQLSERLNDYIGKRGLGTTNLADAYEVSRGALIQKMLINIKNEPLHGIGFGIASNPALMEIQRDPVLGLPTGAVIEKGVLPMAILEEVGIFGFVAVAAWGWVLLRRCVRGGLTPLAVVLTALLLNMGESTLFSTGGMGLLSLILLAWGVACGQGQEGLR